MKILAVCLGLITVLFGYSAQAEDCLPILTPDIVNLDYQQERNLALLQQLTSQTKQQSSQSIGASYAGIDLNFADARAMAASLSRLLRIDYSEKERTSLFLSKLGGNALEAYTTCVKAKSNGDISYSFPGDILGVKTFFLQVNWHPQDPKQEKQQARLTITQGRFVESGERTMQFDIGDRKSEFVTIERDPFERAQIAVNIAGKVATIDLPPTSKYRIVPSVLNSEPFKGHTRETRGDVGKDLCIELKDDDYSQELLPDTFQYVFLRKQEADGPKIEGKSPHIKGERRTCGHVSVYFAGPRGEALYDVYATIRALKAIPK